jgi:hypothetical protein
VWEKVPAAGTESVVVEPGAEDEIGSDGKEDTKKEQLLALNIAGSN